MIESSKDLLFLVLAFCILWLTVFISWLLYYAIAILRDTEHLIKHIRSAVDKVEKIADFMKDKVEGSAASLSLIAQAVKELIIWAIKQRQEKKAAPVKKKR